MQLTKPLYKTKTNLLRTGNEATRGVENDRKMVEIFFFTKSEGLSIFLVRLKHDFDDPPARLPSLPFSVR